ncbi:RNA-dependent RNA polymerase [Blechomonas maslovi leishbunyavirus 1]|uniref:RNA-directed RNA polymerase L n=1 Tax=Blechomonas maslovi leishbunyavirus 1 TaxID=2364199 RepID=A0A386IS86_9VIRU|nr:RNA-dependent RNA polymerase [Blechomonas maslovi leishbunyavirus 1]
MNKNAYRWNPYSSQTKTYHKQPIPVSPDFQFRDGYTEVVMMEHCLKESLSDIELELGAINKKEKRVSFHISGLPLELTRSMNVTQDGMLDLQFSEIRTLAHEAVCSILMSSPSGRLDLSRLDILPPDSQTSDSRLSPITPDFAELRGNNLVVLEVKTCRGSVHPSYDLGLRQYRSRLAKSKTPVLNTAVAVSDSRFGYSECLCFFEETMDLCMQAVCLSHQIMDVCFNMGLKSEVLPDIADELVKIPNMELAYESEDQLIITKKMVEFWDAEQADRKLLATILSVMKENPSTQSQREADKAALLKFLTKGNRHCEKEAISPGPILPTQKGNIKPSHANLERIENMQLRELATKLFGSESDPGHLTLKHKVSDYVFDCRTDFMHGLWSTLIDDDTTSSVFRHINSRLASRQGHLGSVHWAELGFTRVQREFLIDAKKRRRANKRNLDYLPEDYDVEHWSEVWTKNHPIELREGPLIGVDDSIHDIPYQGELWYQHTHFYQRLVEEVNVGRYSSKGAWKRFHVQKVAPYDAWLMVHGTGQDSHQFYYCIAHLRTPMLVPGDWCPIGDGWWVTEVVQSLKIDKITQNLNLLERLVSLRHYWSSVFSDPIRSRQHFFASMMIAYDGKQATIDLVSLFRYLYMELCKEKTHRNPYKLVSKLPFRSRTRCQSWILYRMGRLMLTEFSTLGTKENDEDGLDFKELTSWVDGGEISHFGVILSLSYMHYATSHPVSGGLHGRVKIMGKLLKEELKLPQDCRKIGWSSPSLKELGSHEFSVGFVKHMGEYTGSLVRRTYPSFSSFWSACSRALTSWTYSDFSTFKKSTCVHTSDPGQRDYCFSEVDRLRKRLGLTNVDKVGYSPFHDLDRLLKEQLTNSKNQNVSIFVKDQQTGVREIFVLTICLRILVKFLEVISRVINRTLPNETLSEPARKNSLVIQHSRLSSERRRALSKRVLGNMEKPNSGEKRVLQLRFSSSSDAKAWCQQFCMPLFGCYYNSLLKGAYGNDSSPLLHVIFHILNQLTQKRIQMDTRVTRWFRLNPDTVSDDEAFTNLSNVLNGRSGLLAKDGGVINRSNMMQGIPHETSSSVHASYLMLATHALSQFCHSLRTSQLLPGLELGEETITNLVSSDDSGIIFTLPIVCDLSEDGNLSNAAMLSMQNLREMLSRFGLSIELCKGLFSAQVSYEKSTIFAETPVFEFNSKFYVGTSINTAEIKFITAPLTLGYHVDIRDRISESLSSLSGALSEGVRQDQLDVMQVMLNRIQRRFLYLSHWEDDITTRLNRLQLPSLGWMPLVRRGLIGFFNLSLLCDYAALGSPSYYGKLLDSMQRTDSATEHEFSLFLRLTSKYSRLVKQYNLDKPDIVADIHKLENGTLRFFTKELPESLVVRLKLLSPGARLSLTNSSLAKIHMASCYAATRPCITVRLFDGSLSKRPLKECLELKEHTEGTGLAYNPQRNLVIHRFKELLCDAAEVPLEREECRQPSWFTLWSESTQHGLNLRKSVVDTWTLGYSQSMVELFDWIHQFDPRLSPDFNTTLKNYNNDIFEIDRALYFLEDKNKIVRCLGFRPPGHSQTDFYVAFLASNWTRDRSLSITTKTLTESDPIPCSDEEISNHAQELLSVASMAVYGWTCFQKWFMKKFNQIKDAWTKTLDTRALMTLPDLLCACSSKHDVVMIDVRKIRTWKNNRIYVTKQWFYERCGNFVYKAVVQKGCWVIYRQEGDPILCHLDLKQLVATESDFLYPSCSLRAVVDRQNRELCIRSTLWEHVPFPSDQLELRKRFDREMNFASCPLPGFLTTVYLQSLPKLTSPFSLSLTQLVLENHSELSSWSFWESVCAVLSSSEYDTVDKSLCSDLLVNVQADLKKSLSQEQAPIWQTDTCGKEEANAMVFDEADAAVLLANIMDAVRANTEEEDHELELLPEDERLSAKWRNFKVNDFSEILNVEYDTGPSQKDIMSGLALVTNSEPRCVQNSTPVPSGTRIWSRVRAKFLKALIQQLNPPKSIFKHRITSLPDKDTFLRNLPDTIFDCRNLSQPTTLEPVNASLLDFPD